MKTAFERYLDLEHVKTRTEAARRLEISRAMVDHIVSGLRNVSVEVALKIWKDSDGAIDLHELNPKVWPRWVGRPDIAPRSAA